MWRLAYQQVYMKSIFMPGGGCWVTGWDCWPPELTETLNYAINVGNYCFLIDVTKFCPGKRHSQYVHKIPFLKQVLKAIFSSQIQGKQQPRSTRLVSIGKISANALIQQPCLSGCERGNSLSLNALKTAQTQPVVYRYVAWYDYKVQKYICYIERLI